MTFDEVLAKLATIEGRAPMSRIRIARCMERPQIALLRGFDAGEEIIRVLDMDSGRVLAEDEFSGDEIERSHWEPLQAPDRLRIV
jgi:hypothetical protein